MPPVAITTSNDSYRALTFLNSEKFAKYHECSALDWPTLTQRIVGNKNCVGALGFIFLA